MFENNPKRYVLYSWMLIALCAFARLVYAQSFLLVPDETNYWQWARHLSWGYYDQSPLIAWSIYISTALLGHAELGVRLPSIIAMSVASAYLMLIARRWFSARTAWYTVLLSQSILMFNVGGLLATPDGLQGAAWAAASYHTARAFESNQWRQWLAGGVWFGIGMLSKYTMVLFLPCILAFGLFSRKHRRLLTGIRPYVGCAAGCLMFLPVIVWNAANSWNSVRHVAHLGGADKAFTLHLNYLGDFIGSQAGLLSPLVFIFICICWFGVLRRRLSVNPWINAFLFFTSFPVFVFFALLSLHARVYGNWAGAGYLTAIVLTAAWFAEDKKAAMPEVKRKRSRIWRWTFGSSCVLTALLLIQVAWPVLPIPAHMDRTAYEILGWQQLGLRADKVKTNMPRPDQTFFFGLRYQIASELAFYVPGQPHTVSINRWNRPNVYDDWWKEDQLLGMDGVGVLRDGRSRRRLLEVFENVDPPRPFTVYRPSPWAPKDAPASVVKTLYIYQCHRFKGGLRWMPSHRRDIRVGSLHP